MNVCFHQLACPASCAHDVNLKMHITHTSMYSFSTIKKKYSFSNCQVYAYPGGLGVPLISRKKLYVHLPGNYILSLALSLFSQGSVCFFRTAHRFHVPKNKVVEFISLSKQIESHPQRWLNKMFPSSLFSNASVLLAQGALSAAFAPTLTLHKKHSIQLTNAKAHIETICSCIGHACFTSVVIQPTERKIPHFHFTRC
jgi:hypothetical protein